MHLQNISQILDNCSMVMLAHIKYPLIDSKVATYSSEIIDNILTTIPDNMKVL